MNRLHKTYIETILPALKKELGRENTLSIPRLTKIVVSVGVGTKEDNHDKALVSVAEQLAIITGQKPKKTIAKQAIAGFKTRQGDVIGLMVTLHGDRMWEFMDKLSSIVLPRVKDFQGISNTGFDGHGNYNLGMTEQIVFPEIEYDKIDRIRGLQVTIVTSAKNDVEARKLLVLLGVPFAKVEKAS